MTQEREFPVLDARERRVIGVLLEKQVTVPATYPLSLSAVRTGCNQSSSRDPLVDYDEAAVEATLKRLKEAGLVRIVWAATGRRTLKYHQILDEVIELDAAERALMTLLLLRGPQAPGELRTRSERLHPFADREAAERCLRELAGRPRPLVRQLPRQRGQQDARWTDLLGDPVPDIASAAITPAVDREAVLALGATARDDRVRAAYGVIAAAYAEALADELAGLDFERWLLDRVAAEAADGAVVEVGCGPGHVTAHLAEAGADATGIDVAVQMVEVARARFPDGDYQVGDLRRLMRPVSAPGWSAVLAWYSLIHLAPSELPEALGALVRPLLPGGLLVLGLHAGHEVRHIDSWFGHGVDLDQVLHEPADVIAMVAAAGLESVEWYVRGPIASRGEKSERLYVLARKPSGS